MFMEVISIIISALALVVSIISFVKSNAAAKTANGLNQTANHLAQTANDLTQGQVEMQIRSMITSAKSHFAEMSNQLAANEENETLKASVSAALEDVANAYDEACMKYLDGKVDKDRFKRAYINEIKNWVENDAVKDKYVMPQSKFHATVKVYNEWYNLEQ